MRISDWSSDVCSSDLFPNPPTKQFGHEKRRYARADALYVHPDPDGVRYCRASEAKVRFKSLIARWRYLCSNRAGFNEKADLKTAAGGDRAAERTVGKECVRPLKTRGRPKHKKT